jgi:hypothetical protein
VTGKKTPASADQFNIRFPPGMRDQIAEMARRNGRSMNSEIVARLAQSVTLYPVESLLKISPGEMAAYDQMRREEGQAAADNKFFPEAVDMQQAIDWLRSVADMQREMEEVKQRLLALERKNT